MQTRIDEETVAELRDVVRDLLRDEDARAQSLTATIATIDAYSNGRAPTEQEGA